MCNKQQNMIPPKDVPLTRKNKLSFLNTKDYDNAFKQKDVDTLQKNRLISQQKKLLDVRDELIEMLKTRCDMEMEEL